MKALLILMIMLALFCAVTTILAATVGIHETVYPLPNGDTLTIQGIYQETAILSDGNVIEPIITDENVLMFWVAFVGFIIFGLAVIIVVLCLPTGRS